MVFEKIVLSLHTAHAIYERWLVLHTEKYCKHLVLILYLYTLLGSVCNNGRWMR